MSEADITTTERPSYRGRVLTVKEVAEVLHINPATVRLYVNEGYLETLPLPIRGKSRRLLRITGGSLDKLLGN